MEFSACQQHPPSLVRSAFGVSTRPSGSVALTFPSEGSVWSGPYCLRARWLAWASRRPLSRLKLAVMKVQGEVVMISCGGQVKGLTGAAFAQ